MKRIVTKIALAAAAVWLLALHVAAQSSHGQGHPGGMGSAAGSMGESHAANARGSSSAAGPRTASQMLSDNKQLATKLSGLLPAGTDLQTAASGFKNLGQFVAAVHVSHNLDIPFDQLKCTELATKQACTITNGTTTQTLTVPSKGSSLGQAIQTLKPSMSSSESKSAAKQAQKQADGDIRSTAS
jgi:hypothetical protein